jgi:hypothetical protein
MVIPSSTSPGGTLRDYLFMVVEVEILSGPHYGIILSSQPNKACSLKCLVEGISQLSGMRERRERPDEMR